MRTIAIPASIFLLALAAPSTFADTVTHVAGFSGVQPGGTTSVSLPLFDNATGVLRNVTITVSADVSGTWAFENTSGQSRVIGGPGSGPFAGVSVPVTLPLGVPPSPPNAAYSHSFVPLAAFDGATDFGGASGVSVPFVGGNEGSGQQSVSFDGEAFLAAYSGAGNFGVGVGPVNQISSPLVDLVDGSMVAASGTVRVTYTFDTFPTYTCRATGASGCPCGTVLPPATIGGCENSVSATGAELTIAGTASIANDTLVLLGTRMTNSTAVYFQGNSALYQGISFGDGLRCVNGSLVRLGTVTNAGGASQYPSGGHAPVSVRGGVTSPGVRAYQALYRDVGAFCTPATFNATSGIVLLWQL